MILTNKTGEVRLTQIESDQVRLLVALALKLAARQFKEAFEIGDKEVKSLLLKLGFREKPAAAPSPLLKHCASLAKPPGLDPSKN